MGYAVAVSLKDGKDIFSPEMDDAHEAQRELELVRAAIGTTETVDLPWLHAKGQDIATADLNEWWE